MPIKHLHEHQERVLAVLARTSALLDRAVLDTKALGQVRWEATRVLRAYQIHKHHYVFDPIIAAGGPPDRVRLACRLKAACIATGERLRGYLIHEDRMRLGDAWPGRRPAALAVIDDLRAHIARERAGIAMLLAGATPPPLRRGAPEPPALRF